MHKGANEVQLFLIRHAPAADRRSEMADAQRPLTARGLKRIVKEVRGLAAAGFSFDWLYQSPLVRTVQTADALEPLITAERRTLVGLARPPNVQLIEKLKGQRVACVGHEPWLGQLAALLVWGEARANALELKKGGVVWLEGVLKPGGMRLKALLPPKLLRQLGQSRR